MIGEVDFYKKKSVTWNFFRKLSHTHAQCNYCHVIYKYQTTVSHLLKHVKKKHSDDFLQFKSQVLVKEENDAPTDEISMTSWPVEVLLQTDESKSWEKSAEEDQLPDIWSLYTEIDDAFAECNLCGVKLYYKDSVSDLIVHGKAKHSEVWLKCDSFEDVPPKNGLDDTSGEGNSSLTPQNSKDSFSNATGIDTSKILRNEDELAAEIVALNEKMKFKKSKTWKYFTLIDKTRSKCKICLETLSHLHISNLMRHVIRKHPHQLLERTHQGEKEAESSADDISTGEQNQSTVSDVEEESEEETCEDVDENGTVSDRTSGLPERIDPTDEGNPTMKDESENASSDELLLSSRDRNSVLEDNTVEAETVASRGGMKVERSKTGKYFTLIDETRAKCKSCQETVSRRSHSNLMKHVVQKHSCRLLARARGGQKKNAEKIADDNSTDVQIQSTTSSVEEGSEEETCKEIKVEENASAVPSSGQTSRLRRSKRVKMEDSIHEENPVSQSESKGKSIQGKNTMTAKRKREGRRISNVWKVFTKLENGFHLCKVCGVRMSKNSCASNLRRHVRRAHPTIRSAMQSNISEYRLADELREETRRTVPIIHTFEREIKSTSEREADEPPGAGYSHSNDTPRKRSEKRAGCLLSERLVQAVEEGNHLLRGLQNAVEKQGEALHRLVACLESMHRVQKNDE